MSTAILIDGAYFIKRIRHFEPDNYFNAQRIADLAVRCAMLHLSDKTQKRELYRIFFYDCPPLEKKMHNPISKKAIDFSKSDEAKFRLNLHQFLLKKRKVALRLGDLSKAAEWVIKPQIEQQILKGQRDLTQQPLTEICQETARPLKLTWLCALSIFSSSKRIFCFSSSMVYRLIFSPIKNPTIPDRVVL